MPLDPKFLTTALERLNPYRGESGTEHVAFLLYSLARMTRPQTIVEVGSGYSTLFVLRALADNVADFAIEQAALRAKSRSLLEKIIELDIDPTQPLDFAAFSPELRLEIREWFDGDGRACAANPAFYTRPYQPRLFSFEKLDAGHEYARQVRQSVEAVDHSEYFTHLCGQSFSAGALPAEVGEIDWAWNDDDRYREFFEEFWPRLRASSGLMIFHNVPSIREWYEAVQWMKGVRRANGEEDVEVLILEEPHKLNQNGCAILRKAGGRPPPFHLEDPASLMINLIHFMGQEP